MSDDETDEPESTDNAAKARAAKAAMSAAAQAEKDATNKLVAKAIGKLKAPPSEEMW